MRAAHYNFFLIADFHFDVVDGLADMSRLGRDARIIHGANSSGFGEAVDLQHWNTEHQEKLLRLWSQRRRSANYCPQIWAESLFDFAED